MIGEKSLWAYCIGNFHDIEGYDRCIADKSKTKWVVHHRLELNEDGTTRYTAKQLQKKGLYYHRDPSELLIVTNKEHGDLHKNSTTEETKEKIRRKARGRAVSAEAKAKISNANKGRKPWNKGRKTTDEEKAKLKEVWTPEMKKRLSEYKKSWWANKLGKTIDSQ